MISLKDIRFAYPGGGFSLNVPSLTVPAGMRAAAVGPSGCGKTTLLNLISGIDTPQSGRVEVAGVRVDELSELERRSFRITHVGFIFQEFLLLDYLDVLNNVLYPYRLHSELRLNGEVVARARQLAAELGIAALLDRRPGQLSQGERQRVAIARALVTEPSLILADEPTGTLDWATKDRVLDLLFERCEARSITLVMVTHDRSLLDRFGQIVEVGAFGTERAQTVSRASGA